MAVSQKMGGRAVKSRTPTSQIPTKDGSAELDGSFTAADVRRLAERKRLKSLYLRWRRQSHGSESKLKALPRSIVRELAALRSIQHLQIWTDIGRQDLRYVIGIPGLKYLDVFGLRGPGRLSGFSTARLERFGSYYLTARDLMDIAACRSLGAIWAHSVKLTKPAIDALLRLPALTHLDLEGSNFSDAHAERLSASRMLRHLDVGATPLTGAGLKHLGRMKQLRELDIWAAMIDEPDIEVLAGLPRLEYLALGQRHDENRFNAQTLVPRLRTIRGLKSIWLDGIKVSRQLTRTLESRYETVRITD